MKKILSLSTFIIIICTIYLACKKDESIAAQKSLASNDEQQLIANAKTYFENNVQNVGNNSKALNDVVNSNSGQLNPIQSLIKNAVWNEAQTIQLSIGEIVVVPIQFNDSIYARPNSTGSNTRLSISKLSKLIVYTDSSNQTHAEVITAFPDSDFIKTSKKQFSGIAYVQDWEGNFLKAYHYINGKIKKLKLSNESKNKNISTDALMAPDPDDGCTQNDYYNCELTEDGPSNCTYLGTTYTGCDDDTSTGGGGGGGGGGSSSSPGGAPSGTDYGSVAGGVNKSNVSSNFVFLAPKTSVNIAQELKCFAANSSSKYSITLNVEEPGPGTGESSAPSVEAGHVYLTFEQDNADGSKIIRNDGFYPINTLAAILPKNTPSTFGDDSYTAASATLKIAVNSQDFMTVVRNVNSEASQPYNLYSYNCTTSAMTALASIGIGNLDTYRPGSPVNGGDPGMLGYTIRNLNLSVYSSLIGGRQVIRNLSNTNSILPSAKQGTCN
jgi:hypothetical protein